MKYGSYLEKFLSDNEKSILGELRKKGLELKDGDGQMKTINEILKEMSEQYSSLFEGENLKNNQ